MSHYVFSFIFSFICNVCNVWMIYYKKKKNPEKLGRGVNFEEEMREKNEMGEGGCVCVCVGVCVVGEKKKKRKAGGTWVVGKRKKGKKKWGVGFTCMVGKKGEWKRKKKKKFEREKTKLVLFVCSLCLVQSVEL
jgi:hypothetical protein